jgi:hypothetical protein
METATYILMGIMFLTLALGAGIMLYYSLFKESKE